MPFRMHRSRHLPQQTGDPTSFNLQFAKQGVPHAPAASLDRQDDHIQLVAERETIVDPQTNTLDLVGFGQLCQLAEVDPANGGPRQTAASEASLQRQRSDVGSKQATEKLIAA